MASRLDLHEELCDLLGTRNVYFQPPETVKLKYPCIVYRRQVGVAKHADNKNYDFTQGYLVQIIAKDPDTPIVTDIIKRFPMIKFNQHFVADNLNHDNYTLYY